MQNIWRCLLIIVMMMVEIIFLTVLGSQMFTPDLKFPCLLYEVSHCHCLTIQFYYYSWTGELLNHQFFLLQLSNVEIQNRFVGIVKLLSQACKQIICLVCLCRKREARRLFLTVKVNLQFYYIPVCRATTPISSVKVRQLPLVQHTTILWKSPHL